MRLVDTREAASYAILNQRVFGSFPMGPKLLEGFLIRILQRENLAKVGIAAISELEIGVNYLPRDHSPLSRTPIRDGGKMQQDVE